jgi:hypothetical protein
MGQIRLNPFMAKDIPIVFVSSTSEDLKAYRNAAQDAAIRAGFLPKMMEYFVAEGAKPPYAECMTKVDEADVLVVIVAHRYGWVPADQPAPGGKSITWLECEQARRRKKEVLAFLVDEKAEWPVELKESYRVSKAIEEGKPTARLAAEVKRNVAKLREFKKWLSGMGIRGSFSEAGALRGDIEAALNGWRGRQGGRAVAPRQDAGPSPKEVLGEQMALGTPGADLKAADFGILEAAAVPAGVGKLAAPGEASWTSLRDSIHSLMHAGLSAVLASAFDLGPYLGAEGALLERATQLGGVMPVVWVSRPGGAVREGAAYRRVLEMRKRLTPLLVTYAQEARERGFPMVRPLALQFAADREAWKWTDEFLLGDELLIAPVYTPENRREVYLPRGIWTDLRSNRVYQSRQTVQVEAAPEELPMLAKNGSIVPLAPLGAGEPWALHYFPKLGAEFFVLEEDLGDYTLLHAAPALEVVRLEIESLKDRDYEWVVHHTGPCRKVAQVDGPEYREAGSLKELKPGAWFYDRERNNLHIRARAGADQDLIINLWLEQAWN